MLQVVCWKWNNGIHPKKNIIFSAKHVNVLQAMVARNLKVDHEFVCITDDPSGINDTVRIIPLWDDYRAMGGCYVRLKAFSKEMAALIGPRFIWLDLDCVVTGDITHLVTQAKDFKMWGDTNPFTPYNGSMVLMDAGSRSQVWTQFNPTSSPDLAKSMRYVGTDQAWIGACLGPNEDKWSIDDGVYSYRMHIRKREMTMPLPPGAKLVFFHGSTDPSQPAIQSKLPWVGEHWRA